MPVILKFDQLCEKWRSVASSQWAEEYPTCNKKIGRLIGLATSYVDIAL